MWLVSDVVPDLVLRPDCCDSPTSDIPGAQ